MEDTSPEERFGSTDGRRRRRVRARQPQFIRTGVGVAGFAAAGSLSGGVHNYRRRSNHHTTRG